VSVKESEQREVIAKAVELLYRFSPREQQLDCIQWLLYQKEDLVLVAKTSFGKSLIMQILPCLVPNSCIVVILPLLALGSEQADAIGKHLSGRGSARPVFVNAKNIGKELLHDIRMGSYTHILISPELLTGKRFRYILKDPHFRSMVRWVVIDELHLVSVWGKEFRKSYALLAAIRHTLGNKPWFGCTATLDDDTWHKVCLFTGLKEKTHIIHTPIDRPDVALIRNVVNKAEKNSFNPLQFVVADASRRRDGSRLSSHPGFHEVKASDFADLDMDSSRFTSFGSHTPAANSSVRWTDTWTPTNYSQMSQTQPSTQSISRKKNSPEHHLRPPPPEDLIPCPQSIPKTMIFTDTRTRCCDMTNKIRQWLQRLGYTQDLATWTVRPFYSTMIEDDKDRILNHFAKPGSQTRILISSEALAHGKDIPDIDIVVIYGMPPDKEPSVFWQKFGRAARASGRRGIGILLGDAWCIGDQDISANQRICSQKSKLSQQVYPADIQCGVESEAFDTSPILSANDVGSCPPSSIALSSDLPISSSPPRRVESLLPKRTISQRKTNSERRAELPAVLGEFMNSHGCIRQPWLKWFKDDQLLSPAKDWCCSNCNPSLNITKFELDLDDANQDTPAKDLGNHDVSCEKELRKWLQNWLKENICEYTFSPPPEFILSKTQLFEISCAGFPTEPQAIRDYLKDALRIDRLGSDINNLIDFIGEMKLKLASKVPMPIKTDHPKTPLQQPNQPNRYKRKPLAELDMNVTPTRKRAKR
jgi:hypothetical protein